ncbi:MAG: hypothetical protein PHC88_00790 [Terrimicrobiaceae bacterium]|nr:hypothetical protein [Terrimicrobiaceae bacterium]
MKTSTARREPRPPGKRYAELATGFLAWKAFDYALYPFVIWKLGPWASGAIMTLLSLVFCLFLLRLYDRLGRNWLGLEFVKLCGATKAPRAGGGHWLVSRGDGVAFVVLSVKYDPFITTAYLRCDAYTGRNGRDWTIFLASWLAANGLWIAVCYGGVSVLRILF